MKVITDIKPQQKTPTRCNIFLNNLFYCGLELETVMKFRLKVGQEIEEEKLDEIQCDSERLKATERALTFLSNRAKTKRQVKEYLQKKGYTEKTVSAVLEKLIEYKYVSDENYAEDYVRVYSNKKGKRLIAMELKQKGVSDEDMQSALNSIENEEKNAQKVAEKYLRNKEKSKENILKCYKYLISKGFDYDLAKQTVERIKTDEDDLF
ncbi:MAG: RecX family transcriptional regulator [Clostridia bacterium]|nr:RecX family transcriptional regulator [Clostridia bacterium]